MRTDEQLVARLAQGDEGALGELVRRYEQPLSRFLSRHTGGNDVDDLYQETWLRVVRSASRFDPARRFSTWLFQIAVNLCRDWYRRRRADPVPVDDVGADSPDLRRAEARMDAFRLLAQLPEAQREVLILRYYHDLSEGEAAEILGVPPGTVKSRLHNAIARLGARVRGNP
jgi:RNA polymerase sigma-70 factor (ECF subfamily)